MPVVQIALEASGLLVDRDDNGLGAGRLELLDSLLVAGRNLCAVQLGPPGPVGTRCDFLDWKRCRVGDDHRCSGCGGAFVHAAFGGGMQVPLPGAGRDHDGKVHPKAQHFGRCVHRIGRRTRALDQFDPVKRLAVSTQREFKVGPMGHVVITPERHVRETNRFEVERRHHFVESGYAPVLPEPARVKLGAQKR